MLRSKTHVILLSSLALTLFCVSFAQAWSFLAGGLNSPFNQCLTCHVSNGDLAMNPYGQDYLEPSHATKYQSKHNSDPGLCNNCHSGKGYPLKQTGLDAMDSDGDAYTNLAEFSAGTFPGDASDYPADTAAPVVTAFSMPATSTSLTVAVTGFAATDNVAVTGYMLSESAAAPNAGDAGWSATAPSSYAFATADVFTVWAWAKDAAGNVSSGLSAQVDTTPSQQHVNTPPVAFGGDDQFVLEGQTVALDAGGSTDDAGIISYAWVQLDGSGGAPMAAGDPLAVVLSDTSSPTPAFVTPAVSVNGATLIFALTVTDGDSAQDMDEVWITVDDNGISDFDGLPGVISTQTPAGDPIGISVGAGSACTRLNTLTLQDVPAAPSQPANLLYGLLDFELKVDVNNPALALVTIYFPAPVPADYKWYKYNSTQGWYDFDRDLISGGTGEGAAFNADRSQVTLYLQDNSAHDNDSAVGTIRDPGGLASSSVTTAPVSSPGSNSFGGSGGGCFVDTVTNHADISGPGTLFFGTLLLLAVIQGIFSNEDRRK